MSIKKAICSSTSSLEQDICNLHPACVRYVRVTMRRRGEGRERGGEGEGRKVEEGGGEGRRGEGRARELRSHLSGVGIYADTLCR